MKHFWKTTGSLFGKMVIAKVFGFILSFTILMALSGEVGSLVTQLCSLMIVVVLMFSAAWELGSKDANMIGIQKLKSDKLLGLKAGLVACIPDIVAAICLILVKYGVIGDSYTVLYGLYNSSFLPFHQALLPQTITVLEHNTIGYFLSACTAFIGPICAGFGYRLGLYQISLSDTLLYVTPEARKRHEERLKARRSKKNNRLFR